MTHRSSSRLTGASAASAAVPVPAGAAVDDIAVVGIYIESAAAITPPSGFTSKADLQTSATARGRLAVFWKRLTAADSGTYSFTWTGSAWREAVCGLWSGRVTTGDPFDGTVGTAESTTGVTTLNVSTSPAAANGDALGMWTNFSTSTSWTPPTNYTERQDGPAITLDTRDAVAAGSTGNVSATAVTTDFIKAFLGVLAISGGGGSNFIQTPTDNLGLTDSPAAVSAFGRPQDDALGLTDALATALVFDRTQTDPLGLTDTFTVASDFPRSQTDALGLTDSVLVENGKALVQTDPLGLTDAAGLEFGKNPTDTLGLTDSATTASAFDRSSADVLGLTDSVSAASAFDRTQTDAVGLSDSALVENGKALTQTDPIGLTDAAVTVLAFSRAPVDPLGLTDAVALDRAFTTADAAGLSDTMGRTAAFARTTTDIAGLSDDVTVALAGPVGPYTAPPRWAVSSPAVPVVTGRGRAPRAGTRVSRYGATTREGPP